LSNYYTNEELKELGFKKYGKNLKISKKSSLYNCELMEFGNDVRIDDFCVLSGKLVFGSNIHIAAFCFLSGGDEGLYFDDFTGFAYRVTAFTKSDDYSGETLTNPTIPLEYRYRTKCMEIYFGKHAIVGAGSIILPGAHIEKGVSVGAISLVVKPTEPWGMYFGSPAKRIKDRSKNILGQEAKFLAERNEL